MVRQIPLSGRLKLFNGDQVVDYRESRDIDSLLQFVLSNTASPKVSESLVEIICLILSVVHM